MTTITTTIEINLGQMLGEKELPSPEQPVAASLGNESSPREISGRGALARRASM